MGCGSSKHAVDEGSADGSVEGFESIAARIKRQDIEFATALTDDPTGVNPLQASVGPNTESLLPTVAGAQDAPSEPQSDADEGDEDQSGTPKTPYKIAGRDLQYHPFRLSPAITVERLLEGFNRRHTKRMAAERKAARLHGHTPLQPSVPHPRSRKSASSSRRVTDDEPNWMASLDRIPNEATAPEWNRPRHASTAGGARQHSLPHNSRTWSLAPADQLMRFARATAAAPGVAVSSRSRSTGGADSRDALEENPNLVDSSVPATFTPQRQSRRTNSDPRNNLSRSRS